ncbi:MAG: cytochrome c biogenesis protein CcsA [Nitrospirae bacterium]|nr:cytochrome c biogenesis protein CcsA [Nitrospirota bacterium]
MDSSFFFGFSTVAYIVAMMTYITYIAFKNQNVGRAATSVTIAGFISQSIALISRWAEFYDLNARLGQKEGLFEDILRSAPLTNLYESLIFFVWCLILGYLIVEFKYKNRSFGAFVTPVAGLALAFINLSGMSKEISPLVPALKSNWLLVHVLMSFISYACFALSFVTALMFLSVNTERQEKKTAFWAILVIFALLFGITTQSPETVLLWIISFGFVLAVDIKLNIDITRRIFLKKDSGSIFKSILTTIGLSLVSISAIFIFIQLVKFQLIKAEEAAMMKQLGTQIEAGAFKGTAMGVVGLMFFVCLVLIKYLILDKGYYLFWTLTSGLFIAILSAMGLDFLKFKVMGSAISKGESSVLKATFLSHSPAISVVSYAMAVALLYAVWRYGEVLKKIISGFNISSETLDEITYKSITIGFPIFTLGGLIFGAIWADQAWGVYWSWDPKETWSLITWLVYTFFLHARLLRGWRGHKISVVAVLGFAIVIFTYLGVNMLLSGLHAYGAIE